MRMNVLVKSGRKENKVIKKDFAGYEVWIKSKPIKGAANKELITVLSDYFNVKKNQLRILRGLKIPNKIVELKK